MIDFSPLFISLKVALAATVIAFAAGLAAARMVLYMKRFRYLADGLFSLPLVLPPTVTGFFLLMLFGTNSPVGELLAKVGINMIFTWQGAVAAAAVVAFPIMYRTALGAMEQVDKNILYAARTLGMSERNIFLKVLVPAAAPGIGAGAILSFGRAIGEFGATIMIAGNIPGKTQTMPVAIYTAIQGGNRETAYVWVVVVMVLSVAVMILMNCWSHGFKGKRRAK